MESEIEKEILSRLKRLEELLLKNSLVQKAVLNMEEAAKYLKLSVSYLYKLTSRKLIPHFKSRGKIINFDRAELDEWSKRNPVMTQDQVEAVAGSKLRELDEKKPKQKKQDKAA